MVRQARTARSYSSSIALLYTAIIVVNLCATNAAPVESREPGEVSKVNLIQEVRCLFKGFTPLECSVGKRTRKVNEIVDGSDATLLNPLALVHARISETPRSHQGTASVKSPPAKKQDGFYSDW